MNEVGRQQVILDYSNEFKKLLAMFRKEKSQYCKKGNDGLICDSYLNSKKIYK